jgi:hypothetical protein
VWVDFLTTKATKIAKERKEAGKSFVRTSCPSCFSFENGWIRRTIVLECHSEAKPKNLLFPGIDKQMLRWRSA